MPALGNIIVNDGETTPVAHTFSPVTTDGYLASWKERVGVPVGYPALSASMRPPVKGGETYKEQFRLAIPVTAVVNGITVVDFVQYGEIIYTLHERATEQQRKNIRVMLGNVNSHANFVTMTEKLEPTW